MGASSSALHYNPCANFKNGDRRRRCRFPVLARVLLLLDGGRANQKTDRGTDMELCTRSRRRRASPFRNGVEDWILLGGSGRKDCLYGRKLHVQRRVEGREQLFPIQHEGFLRCTCLTRSGRTRLGVRLLFRQGPFHQIRECVQRGGRPNLPVTMQKSPFLPPCWRGWYLMFRYGTRVRRVLKSCGAHPHAFFGRKEGFLLFHALLPHVSLPSYTVSLPYFRRKVGMHRVRLGETLQHAHMSSLSQFHIETLHRHRAARSDEQRRVWTR